MTLTMSMVYVRRHFASLSDDELRKFLYSCLLLQGFPTLASLLYLSLESKKCLQDAPDSDLWTTEYNENYNAACQGMVRPQQAVSVFLLLMFGFKMARYVNRKSSSANVSIVDVIERGASACFCVLEIQNDARVISRFLRVCACVLVSVSRSCPSYGPADA